ncbi:MAG: insulinase family protein [Planctomycetota bacterium]|nr:MAG: insulinase family protein [Planctomycetota bacterium]
MNRSNDPYTVEKLDNGLTVVIERMPGVRSAAAGFFVRTGARDEPPELAGVSHFLEHMMFKGTRRRTWQQITIDFDRMGSTYNAYTSEDRTVYYGWVRREDILAQIELLADMMRPALPPEEFDMEKNVVLEEIAMSKDNLDHLAFDFLQEKVFDGHPLAWPVLGYERTVREMTRDQMQAYFEQRYIPGNMRLVVTGNVDPAEILDAARRYCGDWPKATPDDARTPPTLRTGVDVLTVDRFHQQVVALTYPAVSAVDDRAETAGAAAAILGSENSRFFWNIVQKGLAPRAGTYHLDYTDCGAMILFGVCDPDKADAVVGAMREEACRICREPVKPEEVERVRNKRRTGLAVESEVPYHRLVQVMDDVEFRGAPRTIEQMLADVEAVTVETIQAYFDAFPIDGDGHLTSVGPRHWPASTSETTKPANDAT